MFTRDSFSFRVLENQPPGTDVGTLTAVDKDSAPYNQFIYVLLQSVSSKSSGAGAGGGGVDPRTLFDINQDSGRVRTLQPLDRELQHVYSLSVGVRSVYDQEYSDTCTVNIRVLDVNDHAPVFTYPALANETIVVSSQTPRGHVIAKLRAVDLDSGQNGNLTYHVVMPTTPGTSRINPFSVITYTGAIAVNADLSTISLEIFLLRSLIILLYPN